MKCKQVLTKLCKLIKAGTVLFYFAFYSSNKILNNSILFLIFLTFKLIKKNIFLKLLFKYAIGISKIDYEKQITDYL